MVLPRIVPLLFVCLGVACTVSEPEEGARENARLTPSDSPERRSDPSKARPPAVTPPPPLQQGQGQWLADVAESAVQSVVNISSRRISRIDPQQHPFMNDPFFREYFGRQMPEQRAEQSLGSGVIVSEDGLVLTNNHVIANAAEIRVSLSEHVEVPAKLIGTDPKSDLAVLKLEAPPEGLKPMPFGDSSQLRLGEVVLAIGDPFGVGQTVTMGIVSAKGRADMGIVDYEDFIQTDAAINPGNSGGALINTRGELVGINTAIISRSGGYQGIGFAIPSNMVRPIMDALVKNGRVVRGWLGVAIQEVTPELAEAMKLDARRGVLVSDVPPGGPAAAAGIEPGDIILEVDGHETHSANQLRNLIASLGPDREVALKLQRSGETRELKVRLGELEAEGPPGAPGSGGGAAEAELLRGLRVAPLDDRARQLLRLDPRMTGVVVEDVEPGSTAAQSGLRPGDVIFEVNRRRISSPRELTALLREAGDRVLLRIHRQGSSIFLLLRR